MHERLGRWMSLLSFLKLGKNHRRTLASGVRRTAVSSTRVNLPVATRAVVLGGCVAVASVLTTGCESRSAPASAEASAWQEERLPPERVDRLLLDSIGVVPLGRSAEDAPAKVVDVAISAVGIAVADERTIMRYGTDGVLQWRLQLTRATTPSLSSPQSIRWWGDRLVAIDMNQRLGLSVISPDGTLSALGPVQSAASLSSLEVDSSGFVVTSIGLDGDIKSGGARFAFVLDSAGATRHALCDFHPAYSESIGRGGYFGYHRGLGARVHDSLVYCFQALTPVVQVHDLRGDRRAPLRVAPPFYRRGADAPASPNQATLNRFAATWTEHAAFFPHDSGFVSVYTTFDTEANERIFLLFSCRLREEAVEGCRTGRLRDRPYQLLPPDTLVTIDYSGDDTSPVRLRYLRLR